jgi:6-phosphogluconolactonase/glucosamine-6-phosphate isomerase/deaminase
MDAYRKLAEKAVDAHMEYKMTFIYAASVLALRKAHAKVNWDKYFQYFQDEYRAVLDDPNSKIKEVEEVLGGEVEFQWKRDWEE